MPEVPEANDMPKEAETCAHKGKLSDFGKYFLDDQGLRKKVQLVVRYFKGEGKVVRS